MLGGPVHAGQATNHGGGHPAVQLPLLLLPLQAQAPLEDPRDGGCNCPRVGQAAGVAEGREGHWASPLHLSFARAASVGCKPSPCRAPDGHAGVMDAPHGFLSWRHMARFSAPLGLHCHLPTSAYSDPSPPPQTLTHGPPHHHHLVCVCVSQSHLTAAPFVCNLCGFASTAPSAIGRHKKAAHPSEVDAADGTWPCGLPCKCSWVWGVPLSPLCMSVRVCVFPLANSVTHKDPPPPYTLAHTRTPQLDVAPHQLTSFGGKRG